MSDKTMNDAPAKTMTPFEWGLLLLLSLVWGGSFFFVGVAVKQLPPFTIVALRVSLAALALWITSPLTGVAVPRDVRAFVAFLGMGLLNNVIPFCLIVWGQTQIASGLAAILNATTPLFTVLVAHFATSDEKLTPLRLIGALCGLAGVALLIGPQLADGLGGNLLAELAIVGAAVAYAFAALFGRRFRRLGISAIATATGQVTASSLMLVPLALVVDRPWGLPAPNAAAVAAILGLACVSTALAYVIYFRILAGAGATNVALVTFLAPVSAIVLGALFLGERLAMRHFLGLAIIGAGLACIDGRLVRRLSGLVERRTLPVNDKTPIG